MRISILDAHATDQGDAAMWDPIRALGETTIYPRTLPSELLERCRTADAILTNKVPLDDASLSGLPALRYIGVTATGTNIVALDAARAHRIAVSNVPGYSTASVAQHVIALLLHMTNDVAALSQRSKAGAWAASPDYCFFRKPLTELADKVLVIIGMGMIGAATGRIASSLGMRVIAAQVPGSLSPGRMALGEALAQADAVTLHCPMTPQTTGLVDDRFLAGLKSSAILINTGRGGLLDEAAVLRALQSGRLGGLGIDVLGKEPALPNHPLLAADAPWADRVVVTPHVAWGTTESRRRLVADTAENLAAFMRGVRRNRVEPA